jgi:hypothetical protein
VESSDAVESAGFRVPAGQVQADGHVAKDQMPHLQNGEDIFLTRIERVEGQV